VLVRWVGLGEEKWPVPISALPTHMLPTALAGNLKRPAGRLFVRPSVSKYLFEPLTYDHFLPPGIESQGRRSKSKVKEKMSATRVFRAYCVVL